MRDADTTAGLPPPPDPPQIRPGKPIPQNIARMLILVRVLIGYGRHLAETLEHRAAARGFSSVAQFFGTARVTTIHARLARGLLRAMALERVLLARAARGRDLVFHKSRQPKARAHPTAPAATPQAPRRPRVPPADPDETPALDALPTLEQLEAEIRRRPIGQAVAAICQDLAISPSLCEGQFWFALSCAIMWYRGNLPRLMKTFRRREVHFCDTEADRNPALGWPEPTREGIRRRLGFFIGEPPVTPFPLSLPFPGPAASPQPP